MGVASRVVAAADSPRAPRLLALGVIGWALLRLLLLCRLPLLGAEAYYWEWGQEPAWGYFDHPPMIGLLLAGATRALGNTIWAVKCVPVVLSVCATGLLYLLARDLFGRRVAVLAAALLQLLPLAWLSGTLAVPDAPLTLCWLATLLLVERATLQGRRAAWYGAGLLLGLGLLSKYHMVLTVPCVGLFLLLSPRQRFWLRRPEPWLAGLLGLVVFLPNLWWNLSHRMTTVAFLMGERHGGLHLDLAGPLLYVAGFLALVSPLVGVLLVRLAPPLWRAAGDERYRFLLCMSLPIILFFLVLTPFLSVGAHWPAIAYVPLLLAGLGLLVDPGCELNRRWPRVAVGFALATTLLALAGLAAAALLPPGTFGATRLERELRGWSGLGDALAGVMAQMPGPERTCVITHQYRLASQIRFVSESRYVTRVTGHKSPHQYGLWNRQRDCAGWDALFVGKRVRHSDVEVLARLFERVDPPESLVVRRAGVPVREFRLIRCYGLRSTNDG